MRLKRVFDQAKLVRDKVGKVVEVLPGAVIGVEVERSGGVVKHFSPKFVIGGQREGWLRVNKDSLVVDNINGDDIRFKIIRYPGHYCDHCEVKIENGNSFVADPEGKDRNITAALAHMLTEHKGLRAVNTRSPAGIRKEEFYTCVRCDNSETVDDLAKLEKTLRIEKAKNRKVRGNG